MAIVRRVFKPKILVEPIIPWGESRKRVKASSVYDDVFDVMGDDVYFRGFKIATLSNDIPATIREEAEDMIKELERDLDSISIDDANEEKQEAIVEYKNIARRASTYLLLVQKRKLLKTKA